MDDEGGASWLVVRSQPRRETLAERSLERLGPRVFCPRYQKRTIIRGYRRTVSAPLFPGYLFVAFDPQTRWRAVHYAHGVRGIVFFGNEPAFVPPDLIAAIEARLEEGHVVLDPPLRPGQRVEVTVGPFRGYTGIFQSQRSDLERVAILLDCVTYHARVLLDRTDLRAS